MSTTPICDELAKTRTVYDGWEVAKELEHRLAAVTAERDALRKKRDQWMADCMQAREHRDVANAQLALCEADRDSMRPAVEALDRWTKYATETLGWNAEDFMVRSGIEALAKARGGK